MKRGDEETEEENRYHTSPPCISLSDQSAVSLNKSFRHSSFRDRMTYLNWLPRRPLVESTGVVRMRSESGHKLF